MSENEERALFLLARGQVKRDREMIRQLVKIRKSRESEGLTQKEVAARMGSDQGFVSRFESLETNPNLRTIRAYALAVGAEINYEVYPANCASLTQPSTDSAVPGLTTALKCLLPQPCLMLLTTLPLLPRWRCPLHSRLWKHCLIRFLHRDTKRNHTLTNHNHGLSSLFRVYLRVSSVYVRYKNADLDSRIIRLMSTPLATLRTQDEGDIPKEMALIVASPPEKEALSA
ncbi:helix-turn-helix domain-containing protein [Mobiluncus mulieris]|uniref:helix-turn-helix domain-containing protein n=2 Tax=Mobiluncus mulieris TaxID=2052 RepID=UPI0020939684|nr:helix-turn-helix transcriptional regulator [Mobiluncus mulieris]